jgi:serine/threonine protein kinase
VNAERWSQIKAIFYDAAEVAVGERATYIRSRCGGDETLAVEIEMLLAAHDQASSFIETLPSDSTIAAADAESAAPSEPMIGRRIGAYELIGEIGRGGMGTVYLAERADGLYCKKVAIKLARCGMDSDFVMRRFRNERKILAGLDHPNIASLLDGGATEDGVPYFVMEYVDGKPIAQYCDDNAFTIQERLNLFCSVCSAVNYAHQRSIVHRDIKPSNILVGSDGLPKLLDFGIAKLLEPELSPDAADSTATALRLMTPKYASPEQVRGDPVTPASDVYALGVLLYELLTGHTPYRLKSSNPHEIARVICEQEPEKPSAAVTLPEEVRNTGKGITSFTASSVSKKRSRELKKLRNLLDGDLDSIVLMALHKQPEKRYASVEEFSKEIRRHLEGFPVNARKQMRWWVRITTRQGEASAGDLSPYRLFRSRMTMLFGALTVLVGAGIIYSLLTRAPKSDSSFEIKRVAVLPLKSLDPAETDQSAGLKLADALIQRLGRLDKIVVRPTRAVQGYEGSTLDPLEAGREQQVDVVLDGSFQRADSRMRIRVQLLRVSDGQQLWTSTFDERSTDPFFLEDALTEQAAQALLPHLMREEREIVARHYTETPKRIACTLRAGTIGTNAPSKPFKKPSSTSIERSNRTPATRWRTPD